LCALEEGNAAQTCIGGPAAVLPSLPGLLVEGVGHVPLPLTSLFAKKLVAVTDQAPYGHGMETVADKSVRNTWQIEPSRVRLENAAWNDALDSLVSRAVHALGVNSSSAVRALQAFDV